MIVRDCFAVAPIRANRNHENLNATYQNTRRMLIYSIYNINIKISIMLGYIRKKKYMDVSINNCIYVRSPYVQISND